MNESEKSDRYHRVITQLKSLLTATPDPISRMATVASLLYHKMRHFNWIGFYRLADGELLVGPYQGALACQKLTKDTGVCWTVANQNQTIIVPDVRQFPGHIACDPKSLSEIATPVRNKSGKVTAVFDADSNILNTYDATDAQYLEQIAAMIHTT
jgi:GAF domain-containing protein